ncbi:hypothetical protein [Verrucomicrobium sp. BvORR034]|uniref:hypothetical protein n=1 Tax=Verrucomicrobium sp. BvORR034 TaxID=1396418 RepID=UPI002240F66F|nr:hypothetical protein [Verrucomicrobium sp. BvORR034]
MKNVVDKSLKLLVFNRMKSLLHLFVGAVAVFVLVQSAQAQQTGGKPDRAAIEVLPFAREFMNEKFKTNDREVPDELRATTTDKIRIYGKRKLNRTAPVRGRLSAHFGKIVLVPVGNLKGVINVKSPSADDVTYYYASIELEGGKLDTKIIQLSTGVDYAWSVVKGPAQTTFKITDGAKEVVSLSGPAASVKSVGFASTVRYLGNEADISVTFE